MKEYRGVKGGLVIGRKKNVGNRTPWGKSQKFQGNTLLVGREEMAIGILEEGRREENNNWGVDTRTKRGNRGQKKKEMRRKG